MQLGGSHQGRKQTEDQVDTLIAGHGLWQSVRDEAIYIFLNARVTDWELMSVDTCIAKQRIHITAKNACMLNTTL